MLARVKSAAKRGAMAFTDRLSPFARTMSALAGLAILALIAGLALRGVRASAERDNALQWERHTSVVIIETERLALALKTAEAAQRGYALTRDPVFQGEVAPSLADVRASVARLLALTRDNPGQQRALGQVRARIEQRIAFRTANSPAILRVGGVDPVVLRTAKRLTDDISARLVGVRATEERLLRVRRAKADALDRRAGRIDIGLAAIGVGLGTLAILAGASAFSLTNRSREAARRAQAETRMREALETRVAERTEDLCAANAQLRAEAEERLAAEGQVRQMQKMESIGQLTGGIAHDFNNMLAIVIGSLDMARRRFDADPERAKIYIGNAEEGAKRAAQLTARLLAFSRQQPLAPESLDVNKLVGETSELVRRTIGEQIRIETVLAGGLWRANVDRGQIENAILNLSVNARDAMPDGGRLTLETSNTHLDEEYARAHAEVKAGQYVVICVTDAGTGMAPDIIERAFDPFFTTKQVGKGTGLGLSQVFGFVKQSGGHVKIYSEEGVGTTVKLYLPRWFGTEAELSASSRVAEDAALARARPDEIVLVVEDEQRVRHLTCDTLRELGYTVVQANDGEEALEQLRIQPRIDLLFTDIVMPGINGRELVDRARVLRPGLRVLYTTGYTRNAVVHNGMLDPGVALLSKPFSIRELAVRVRAILDTPAVDSGSFDQPSPMVGLA